MSPLMSVAWAKDANKAQKPKTNKVFFTSKLSQVSPRIVKPNSIANGKFFMQHGRSNGKY
jgi:hypothetical protein